MPANPLDGSALHGPWPGGGCELGQREPPGRALVAFPLPARWILRQGFHWLGWAGNWSTEFDHGRHRRSLIRTAPGPAGVLPSAPGAGLPGEHRRADRPHAGPPLITLANIAVAPLAPAAAALRCSTPNKVRFQGQEVAFVVAEDRYSARDALELIDVDYEPLNPVVDARKALDPDAEVIRTDLDGKTDNHCFDWETGDAAATEAVFAKADVVVKQEIVYPRVHPAPMETCGAVADLDPVTGKLTLWSTTQAPHAHRTLYALVAGLPEHKIRVISPDIGGGFGNKVPIYPGYVCAIVGSLLLGKPVKWMEDRSENLTSTGFARDYIMVGEIAATSDGKILAIRSNVLADHGAFNGTAAPVKYPAGFFGVFTGSYDIEAAYCHMTAVYTNKAPGGVAYACSFRITEAVYFVERLVDCLAFELKMDPAQLRLQNLLKPDQFPYKSKTGWVYDSGDYEKTMRLAMDMIGYDALRAEQKQKRERGELMGIGMSFFTEAVGAGPRKDMDILGLGMADGCELRVHPTGKAVVRLSVQTQGQGHETTFAQIVAEELGIPPDDIDVVHGDTDQTPFGLGTYGSRSTPVSARRRRWWPARSGTKPRSSRAACSRPRLPTWNGTRAHSTSRATRPRR